MRHVAADTWLVLDPVRWIGEDGCVTDVAVGTLVNGASIPRVAWSIIGHPFEGDTLRPSIVHDDECRRRVACGSTVVHQRFRHMLRAEGVGRVKAWAMYQAVRWFGPQWEPRA